MNINVLTNSLLGSSGPATKTWVDARIAIAGSDTDGITESHTFTVTVTKDTGTGSFVAANGEDVNVTLTSAAGATYVLNTAATTCDVVGAGATSDHLNPDTVGSGTCIVVFTSNTAGTVTGTASSSLTVGGVPITVTTNGANGNSGTVLKTFVSGSILWHKNDNHGNRLAGATFEICRLDHINTATDPDTYVNDDPDVCFSITDNKTTGLGAGEVADEDATNGNLSVSGLVLGRYTARETAAPAGYHIDNALAVPFDDPMTIADPNIEIATPFVNSKAFRLIAFTCDDITDKLVVSTTTLNTVVKSTISTAQFEALGWKDGAGVLLTEAALCGFPGANYGPLDEGTYNPSVKIPQ